MQSQQLLERIPDLTSDQQTTKKKRTAVTLVAAKTAATEKEILLGDSRRRKNKKPTESEAVLELQEQVKILIEMSARIMQQTAATGETVDQVAIGVHEGLVLNEKTQAMVGDGAEANKDSFSKQRQKLDELNKYMKNIPSRFGCSGSSVGGILRCVFSLIVYVIKSIEHLFKLYIFMLAQFQHLYANALSFLPLGIWIIRSLNIIIALSHGYLLALILSAIGIYIGKPDLCMFMIERATTLFANTIAFIIKSFPTDVMADLQMTGVVVRNAVATSNLGPDYLRVEGRLSETIEIMKTTVANMQSIKSNLSGIGEMATYTTTTLNEVSVIAKATTVGLTTTATGAADEFVKSSWVAYNFAAESLQNAMFDVFMKGGTSRQTKKNGGKGKKKIRLKISKIKGAYKYRIYKNMQIIGEKKYYDDIIELVGSFRVAKKLVSGKKDVDKFVSSNVKVAEVFFNFTTKFSSMSLDVVEVLSKHKKLENAKLL